MKIVVEENDNKRIDKYLSEKVSFSRSLIEKMIKNGNILVNNKSVKESYKVCINDEIIINEVFENKNNIVPCKMDIDIVYEDDDIMIINKASGVVVHPGAGNHDNTLVNGLYYYTKNLSDLNGDERPGIVHRLDKDTSGLMVVAKNNKAHEVLGKMFMNHEVKRTYIALLSGVLPYNKGVIDVPIKRDDKSICFLYLSLTNELAIDEISLLDSVPLKESEQINIFFML